MRNGYWVELKLSGCTLQHHVYDRQIISHKEDYNCLCVATYVTGSRHVPEHTVRGYCGFKSIESTSYPAKIRLATLPAVCASALLEVRLYRSRLIFIPMDLLFKNDQGVVFMLTYGLFIL